MAEIYYLLALLSFGVIMKCDGSIQVIDDDKLTNLIRSDKYIIVLFATNNCEPCDNYETQLDNLKEEIENSLNALTVKVINSQLTRLYSPSKEPALVFFRHGVPLLYDGQIKDDLILHIFENNKDPTVKELTDDTFEHLTQVSTGATTGDWFVMFYSPSCVDCHRLQARWEAVGAQLKSRMNVARVNVATAGIQTGERFNIQTLPSFILFRLGKLYRYQIQKYDVASFTSFAQEWYKNMKPERVPSPQTPFDVLLGYSVKLVQDYPWVWQTVALISLVGFLISLRKYIQATKVQTAEKESKEK